DQFNARFGPAPADVSRAIAALKASGFRIGSVDMQMIHAIAPYATVERVFGTRLVARRTSAGMRLMSRGAYHLPAALAALHPTIMGLGPHYPARPASARSKFQPVSSSASRANPNNRYTAYGSYYADDMKQAYDFPSGAVYNGAGHNIVIVGAANESPTDFAAYFSHEKFCTGAGCLAPEPSITDVNAGGCAFNDSGCDPSGGYSFEANLDAQQAAGMAPGAAVYDVSVINDIGTFFAVYSYLASINVADVVTTSYGLCELVYTAPYNGGVDETGTLTAGHSIFAQLMAQGTTVIFSSGDSAGLNCPEVAYFTGGPGNNYMNVASTGIWVDDPAVTGVGGTNLKTNTGGTLDSTYVAENAVADYEGGMVDPYGTGNTVSNNFWGSGGGFSVVFAEPSFQSADGLSLSGRGVPDIAMHMGGCPTGAADCNTAVPPYPAGLFDSSDIENFAGSRYGAIGTSAAAPDFAGWVADADQAIGGRLGNPDVFLYQLDAFNSIVHSLNQGIPSFNGVNVYTGTGWNPVVGVGTPKLDALLSFAGISVAPAGIPQTASNP
ncbi:MAG TPA: protease pro-enzyme activation domain-containing protein, partial [Candidatus Baltobacteraceae bacterium]|nr:protease pro-enzyme activation domain-containing protein [Candidatus Baltobacteraceae bacterium]